MKKRSLTPIFLSIVFFNSFVDLGHKIIIQNSFYITSTPDVFTMMSAIVNAMILLPYIAMFMPAGFIADRFSKTKVMRYTALAAVPLTILITIFYYSGAFWPAFVMTLLLGIQSALNSPAKYGFIKEQFGSERLTQVNGIVQAVVILAIMLGSFLFSVLFQYCMPALNWSQTVGMSKAEVIQRVAPIGFFLIIGSSLEAWLTWCLPCYAAADVETRFNWRQYLTLSKEKDYLKLASSNKGTWGAIMGLAAFWAVGQVLLADYGAFLKEHVLDPSPSFVNGTVALGSIGLLLGAIYAGRISKNYIEMGLIPLGAIGVTVSLFLLPHLSSKMIILTVFLIFGYFGGLLIVPLNALIQYNSEGKNLGKILAANNFMQNVAMLLFLVLTAILAKEKVNTLFLMYGLCVLALLGCTYAIWHLPQSLARYVVYSLVAKLYHLEVQGISHIPSQGGVLLLGNHTSYLDWAIIEMASPRPVRFVIERDIYQKWYLHWFLKSLNMIPISRTASRKAIIQVGKALAQGEVVALFPEGFITRNGHLGHFQRGFELIVKEHPCDIVPFYIHGLWGTMTSYAKRKTFKATQGRLKRVSINFGAAITGPIEASDLKLKVMALSYLSWHSYAAHLPTLQSLWLKRAKLMKSKTVLIEGTQTISAYECIALTWSLQKVFKETIGKQTQVGILLPPSVAGMMTNIALLSLGKVVVNLNYMLSTENFVQNLAKAELKIVISSKRFLTQLQQKGLLPAEVLQTLRIMDIDTVFSGMSQLKLSIKKMLAQFTPGWCLQSIINQKSDPKKVVAVLFKEDSQGLINGVQLSHHNILSNIQQFNYSLSLNENDKLLSSMPFYDAMGFTLTFLLPLLEGIPAVCYADTDDTLGMAKSISQHKITLLCHTPTMFDFYNQNKRCHPLMLQSVRMAISGMEKLSDNTYKAFKEKFDIGILAGYGSAENSAMVSCNLPDVLIPSYWHVQVGQKPGSVGMPLPGARIKVVDPQTYQELPLGETGLLLIAGPQVMLGYLHAAERNAAAFISIEGERWYRSGDRGYIDADGFLFVEI